MRAVDTTSKCSAIPREKVYTFTAAISNISSVREGYGRAVDQLTDNKLPRSHPAVAHQTPALDVGDFCAV